MLATALAAWGVPRVIPDGIANLSGSEREAALEARGAAWQFVRENLLERLSITRIAVAYIGPPPEPAEPGYVLPEAVAAAGARAGDFGIGRARPGQPASDR